MIITSMSMNAFRCSGMVRYIEIDPQPAYQKAFISVSRKGQLILTPFHRPHNKKVFIGKILTCF